MEARLKLQDPGERKKKKSQTKKEPSASYQLNLNQHVRIWFTEDENTFLNQENQLRFIRLRVNNPEAVLSFVYDKRLLSVEAQEKLQAFCATHRIVPVTLAEIKQGLANKQEKKLLAYAEEEIRHTKENTGGNLAAASDIVRCLSPVCGIYSDFDTDISTGSLPEEMNVEAPYILNVGSIVTNSYIMSQEKLMACNDILAITTPLNKKAKKSQAKQIATIQLAMLENYQTKNASLHRLLAKYGDINNVLSGFTEKGLAVMSGKTIFSVRENIEKTFGSNDAYLVFALRELAANSYSRTAFKKEFDCELTEDVHQKIPRDRLQAFFIKQSKTLVLMPELCGKSDEEIIKIMRERLLSHFYKVTVTNQTGPGLLCTLLKTSKNYKSYAWSHYGLESYLKTYQVIRFGLPFEEYKARINSAKIGDIADASWERSGKEAIKEREEKMHSSARYIQMWYRKHANKAEAEKELEYKPRQGLGGN